MKSATACHYSDGKLTTTIVPNPTIDDDRVLVEIALEEGSRRSAEALSLQIAEQMGFFCQDVDAIYHI